MKTLTKTWRLHESRNPSEEWSRQAGVTRLQARILSNRGFSDVKSAADFLDPRLTSMSDPMEMAGMEEAVSTVTDAIARGHKITVYGDYDADGLTAAALLVHFLSRLPARVNWYIPGRLTEGYGLNGHALQRIARDGTSLVITVDCGTSNPEALETAARMGLNVVVTDHHRVPENAGLRCPFINPNRSDCTFPYKDLAGVGVAFYFMVALRAGLRSRGCFNGREEPDLRDFLDLVALGTVADASPLTGENRAFVKFGLARMGKSGWWGIEALKTICGLGNQAVTSEDVAFKLAPRLNAAGRVGDSTSGMRLLLAREPLETMKWAKALESANKRRKTETRRILESAGELAASNDPDRLSLFMASKGWHRGVLGIAASRLAALYNRPTALLSVAGDMAYGSARSIPGFDLHEAMGRLRHMLDGFGGHAMAAGFSVKAHMMPALEKNFEAVVTESMAASPPPPPEILIDAELSLEQADENLVRDLAGLAPYGEGNPEPCFLARGLRVIGPKQVGENHLKMDLAEGACVREAIGFGMAARKPREGALVDVVFTPETNVWSGVSRVQLRIIDMRSSGS